MSIWAGLGSILGSVTGGLFNAKSTADTNQANVNLWREQTAYNAPQAQMARLTDAGLNPNLVYGQVADAKASSAPMMDAPRWGDSASQGGKSISDYYQIQNLAGQNQLIRQQMREVAARTANVNEDTRYKKYENDSYVNSGLNKGDNIWLRLFRKNSLMNSIFGSSFEEKLRQSGRYPLEIAPTRRD